ncbi:Kynurenine formamidase [Tulasnella sp. 331]|nr:Kynurenine formamidase [Tulasnella sp. 331]
MANIRELPYGDHPLNKLDLYYPEDHVATIAKPPLIVFVHGGAWRSGDKSEYVSFAEDLVNKTGAAVAIVNYRISPRKPEDAPALHHPAHTQDLLDALHKLLEEEEMTFDSTRMILVGHSCGAHMIASIFLQSSLFNPSAELLSSVKGVIVTEGIYDVDLLLRTNPDYISFIHGAFGPATNYEHVSVSRFGAQVGGEHIHWLIVQSAGDELISQDQADAMWEGLRRAEQDVEMDNTSVTENHFELLWTQGFYSIVDKMVSRCME